MVVGIWQWPLLTVVRLLVPVGGVPCHFDSDHENRQDDDSESCHYHCRRRPPHYY